MKILFTNNTLGKRAGTELYVRDVALAMLQGGHDVAAYSATLGSVAKELRAGGAVVANRLDALPWRPDVIHGQHHLEAMTAILHFSGVPAVYICHGFLPWQEVPPLHPHIMRYVAVDKMTLDAVVRQHGVPPERTSLMLSFVDLEKFRPRRPLPGRPRRALLFANYATPGFIYPELLEGCRLRGVELDAVGSGMGTRTDRPEDLLGQYDLVFAKGRSALEAMACGAAVIVCGVNGIGPLVDTAQFDRLRHMSFGAKSLMTELTAAAVARRIDRYDAADAARVAGRVRREAGLDAIVEELLALYDEAIEEFRQLLCIPGVADAASAAYLAHLARLVKGFSRERVRLRQELEQAQRSVAALERVRLGRLPLLGRALERLAGASKSDAAGESTTRTDSRSSPRSVSPTDAGSRCH